MGREGPHSTARLKSLTRVPPVTFRASSSAPAKLIRAELGRAELGRAELGRAELGRAEPGRAELGRAEPGRTGPNGAGAVGQPAPRPRKLSTPLA